MVRIPMFSKDGMQVWGDIPVPWDAWERRNGRSRWTSRPRRKRPPNLPGATKKGVSTVEGEGGWQ